MSTPDMPTPESPRGAGPADAGGASPVSPPAASRAASGPGKLAAAGALAGLLAWSVMLVGGYPFFPEPQPAIAGGASVPAAPTPEELAMMAHRAYLNLTAIMALSGGLFGVGIALGEGVGRRPLARVSLAVFAAAVAGGCAGAAAAWCGQWMLELPELLKLDKLFPARDVLVQGACWGLVGLGVGVGLTLSACRCPGALLGGAAGGLFSALAYAMVSAVGGILVPAGEIPGLIPNSTVDRLLWLMTAAVCIGTGIGIAGESRKPSVQD